MSNPTPTRSGDLQSTPEAMTVQSPPRQLDLLDHGRYADRTRAASAADAAIKLPRRRDAIAEHVSTTGCTGATRQEIADALSMPIQSVCGPVLWLLTSGRLIETDRTRLTQYGRPAAVIVSAPFDDGGSHG